MSTLAHKTAGWWLYDNDEREFLCGTDGKPYRSKHTAEFHAGRRAGASGCMVTILRVEEAYDVEMVKRTRIVKAKFL